MFWLIIFLIVAALVGPIVYLMPTKREKKQASARLQAKKLGLGVTVETIPDLNVAREDMVSPSGIIRSPTLECTVYRLRFGQRNDPGSHWSLFSSNKEPLGFSQSPLEGWFWEGLLENRKPIKEEYWNQLKKAMHKMPKPCLALEVSPEFIAWKGKETFGKESAEDFIENVRIFLVDVAEIEQNQNFRD